MSKKSSGKKTEDRGHKLAGIYGTAEWFITAISVTLVFIVFEMQAYTIPTGSMADTLKGAHFRLRCSQCAYGFDYNFHAKEYLDLRLPANKTPNRNVNIRPYTPRCPSCGFYQNVKESNYFLESGQVGLTPVMKGDRIFVAKCIYQFSDPKRWDVTVFKNPTEPKINYIKRMIGLPGEKIEIIDGDIYVDDKIARKPSNVQEELWMCVYDNDYQPSRPNEKRFNGHAWSQPFVNDITSDGSESKWNLQADGPTVFSLSSKTELIHSILYDTSIGNNFQATYAYDPTSEYPYLPLCSDLMVRFYVEKDYEGFVGVDMSKYGIRYRGGIERGGGDKSSNDMVITYYDDNGKVIELARKRVDVSGSHLMTLLRFANVDHQLVLEYGDGKLVHDLGDSADSAGERKPVMPRVSIIGGGEIKLSHVAVFRDIHYTEHKQILDATGTVVRKGTRAREGSPIKLGKDQFFAMGDNSPASSDSRFWQIEGIGNNGNTYRMGTVPRDYLVGKAFFVYWPGPFRPSDKFIRIIPHVEGMKFIKGG